MNLNQNLSQAELDELADFLDSDLVPDETMDLSMLDGYLTAIAIGPVMVLPSQWLPGIWGAVDEPTFDSLEHVQRILNLITRYYNQIHRVFDNAPERFLPFLYEYEEAGERVLSAEEWCIGFGQAVQLRADAWQPLIADKEFSRLLAPIVAFSSEEAWNEFSEGRDPAEARETLIALLPPAVQAIYFYWLPRREKTAPGVVTENIHLGGSSKARRNALCPCGSGKKFKKCCGAPARER